MDHPSHINYDEIGTTSLDTSFSPDRSVFTSDLENLLMTSIRGDSYYLKNKKTSESHETDAPLESFSFRSTVSCGHLNKHNPTTLNINESLENSYERTVSGLKCIQFIKVEEILTTNKKVETILKAIDNGNSISKW